MSVRILIGDVCARLWQMPDDQYDCVVTSPPYWGLRDYGVEGQIGMEPSLGAHVEVMVEVFRQVRRVLKPSGTLWFNYGDCYATTPNGRSAADTKAAGTDDRTFRDKPMGLRAGVADLCFIINGRAHFLELKSKDGKQTPEQLGFAADCAIAGAHYVLVRNISEALEQLTKWGAIRAVKVAA